MNPTPDPTPAQTGTPTPQFKWLSETLVPDDPAALEMAVRYEQKIDALTAANAELVAALESFKAIAEIRDMHRPEITSKAREALANAREKGWG